MATHLKRSLLIFLVFTLGAVYLSACATEEEGGGGMEEPQTGVNTVEVELTEFEIRMPQSISAGATEFSVTNTGALEHNFEIEGLGIEEGFETNLQPGETREMQVDLQPGSYTIYCPVDGHRDQGMELTLTVE